MGDKFPRYPSDVSDGDEPSFAPTKSDRSLLGTERGTDFTRRFEMDAAGNLFVTVGKIAESEELLHSASLTGIADNTATAFPAFTASAETKVYRVLLSGEGAADYEIRHNGSVIATRRTNLELDTEHVFAKGFVLAFGDTLDAVVTHFSTGNTKDFNLYIYGA